MTLLNDSSDSPRSRSSLMVLLAGGLVMALILAGVWYFSQPAPEPEPAPVAAAEPAPPPAPAPEPVVEPPPEPTPAPRAPRKAKPAPPPPPEPEKPAITLTVESDVPGAMIFLDRKFLGTAPVTTTEVAPGPHTLNASVEGYSGIVENVDITEGPNEVTIRFRVVRLNEAIAVVHKHAIGSCEGRLSANPTGLRYETTNKDHAFAITFAQVEVFEVDYLKKNLRVKQRGGRTWNFTDKNDNADNLFVFHRTVQAARERLAKGDKPAK